MPFTAEVVENPEAAAQCRCASVHFMRHEASASLLTEPMTGLIPQSLIRLHGLIVTRWACRRLARWCMRISAMTDKQFANKLAVTVLGSNPSRNVRDPLDWLYCAMREAAAKASPHREGLYEEHLTTHAQPINLRLVDAIAQLSSERYALLALFMSGARCEEVARWQESSQEDVANRIDMIARELAARVLGSRA